MPGPHIPADTHPAAEAPTPEQTPKQLGPWAKVALYAARTLVGLTFMVSGWLKANDPIGLALKEEDYLTALGLPATPLIGRLLAAGGLAAVEFTLGVMLLCGLHRRVAHLATLVFMLVMTAVTLWLVISNPVSDCGCFGDMLVLTHAQSLAKNILLLALTLALVRWGGHLGQLLRHGSAWMLWIPAALACIACTVWSVYALPAVDFRPYHVGADLVAMRQMNAAGGYDVKIVYQRGTETLLLEADDPDPDSTWTYVETRSTPTAKEHSTAGTWLSHKGDVAFLWMEDAEGYDPTDDILEEPGRTLLLTLPDIATADDGCAGSINLLYDHAQEQGLAFHCLTASDSLEQARWTDYTGAEYPFLRADDRTLWTMVRSNPGLLLLEDGVVVRKWSNWNLPAPEALP